MKRRLTLTYKPGEAQFTAHHNGGKVELVLEGEFISGVEEDLDRYVQVAFPGRSYKYTYRDPSGTLRVGDRVEVPVGYYSDPALAEVVELGRGSYTGPIKTIRAVLRREAL